MWKNVVSVKKIPPQFLVNASGEPATGHDFANPLASMDPMLQPDLDFLVQSIMEGFLVAEFSEHFDDAEYALIDRKLDQMAAAIPDTCWNEWLAKRESRSFKIRRTLVSKSISLRPRWPAPQIDWGSNHKDSV